MCHLIVFWHALSIILHWTAKRIRLWALTFERRLRGMPCKARVPREWYAVAFSDFEAAWGNQENQIYHREWKNVGLHLDRPTEPLTSERGSQELLHSLPWPTFQYLFCLSFLFLLSSRLFWSLWISDLWSFTNLLCSSKATCMTGARAQGQMLAHCSYLSPASPAHLSVKKTWKHAHAHTASDHMLKSAQSSVKHCFSFVLSLPKICWRTKEHWVLYLHP